MRSRDHAQLLLRKAARDEIAMRVLIGSPESPDEAVGFHAQQAVEKLLKAVLSLREIPYRRTHDLAELIDVLRLHGVRIPSDLEESRRLSPFAVEFRYDQLPAMEEGPFDRSWAQNCVRQVRQWAESLVAGKA
jgi:HEPN domain-containing protein